LGQGWRLVFEEESGMLEDLDRIDWSQIGHAIKIGWDEIPHALHRLIDDSGHVDENALESLFWGDEIYDSTPYIVPYILEILPRADDFGKALLLCKLGWIMRLAFGGETPWEMRTNIHVYDAIALAIPTFLELLEHTDENVRQQCVFVLGTIYDEADSILERLAQHFQPEHSDHVKSEILSSMSSLINVKQGNYEYHGQVNASKALQEKYIEFFRTVLISNSSLSIRRHTARFLLYNAYPSGLMSELSPKLFPKPHDAVVVAAEALIDDYTKYTDSLSDHLVKCSIIDLLHKAGSQYISRIMTLPKLTPEEAQWIVKSLARIAFNSRFHDYERDIETVEHLIRKKQVGGVIPPQEFRLYKQQIDFVKTVLNYDLFWEQPSYILSLYCGLPDSRDELLKLIAES
jgi:hypothetical protein